MAFIELPGDRGLLYVPDKPGQRKHACPDCHSCQSCADTRCARCRRGRAAPLPAEEIAKDS